MDPGSSKRLIPVTSFWEVSYASLPCSGQPQPSPSTDDKILRIIFTQTNHLDWTYIADQSSCISCLIAVHRCYPVATDLPWYNHSSLLTLYSKKLICNTGEKEKELSQLMLELHSGVGIQRDLKHENVMPALGSCHPIWGWRVGEGCR